MQESLMMECIQRIQCAEAVVELEVNCDLVCKRRVAKRYRVKEIDERLRRERTKSEAKIISEARRRGVPTPIIFDISDYEIVMERVEGVLAREVFEREGEADEGS
ncbi:MAG TPA: Kae1-associated serine/threonine protein kinase, partial [Methanomicrobia archaeon]|nr:Kae1-associated serine/threonine protein kinase [Methanomicrobia archaeon]